MTRKPNSFNRFWKELKRRKVIHVVTVYAAVAFVILQVTNMVVRPLRLPDWTEAFVIFLLCIGFVISVFVSWVYDITPAGVRKTKPVSAVKHTDQTTHAVSSGWKIATYISAFIILALVAFNFISKWRLNADITKLEKSIAVLPFINDSPSDSTTYFINGLMEEILNNLQKIGAFSKVHSRTSTEQYRGITRPPIPKIAKDLDVNFIVEGSGQKYGNFYRIRVQLIEGKTDKHLWVNSYEREIRDTKDIYGIQSQIAQAIAAELKAVITPEEKKLIEKVPTTNSASYTSYLKGREEHTKYWIDNNNKEALKRAEYFYREALNYDSTFAQAYTGLATAFWDKHYWESYLSENLLDSVFILCDLALGYDNQLSDAYTAKGDYYSAMYKNIQALEEYDKAIKINPNDHRAYIGKANLGSYYDWIVTISNSNKAISIYRGALLFSYLNLLGFAYYQVGFMEKAKSYFDEALKLHGDSVDYYRNLTFIGTGLENFEDIDNNLKKAYAIDSNDLHVLWDLGENYSFSGQYDESLKYFKKWLEKPKSLDEHRLYATHRIGWAYKQTGNEKEAEKYFNEQINYCNKMIDLGRGTYREYYDLAVVYAAIGEKEKALASLRIYNERSYINIWYLSYIKHEPQFNSIRNEPEFQQIIKDVESKYLAEHGRVKKWLEEQGMLKEGQ